MSPKHHSAASAAPVARPSCLAYHLLLRRPRLPFLLTPQPATPLDPPTEPTPVRRLPTAACRLEHLAPTRPFSTPPHALSNYPPLTSLRLDGGASRGRDGGGVARVGRAGAPVARAGSGEVAPASAARLHRRTRRPRPRRAERGGALIPSLPDSTPRGPRMLGPRVQARDAGGGTARAAKSWAKSGERSGGAQL